MRMLCALLDTRMESYDNGGLMREACGRVSLGGGLNGAGMFMS
jgi:hypothetical protein